MKTEFGSHRTSSWRRYLSSMAIIALGASAAIYGQAAEVSDEASLRAAINAKDSNITIPSGASIVLTQALPEITYDATISGATDGTSIIDGADTYPAFEIAAGATVTIQGLTVQKARLTAGFRDGGAAISNAGNLTVNECHFLANTVDVSGHNTIAALGGAIYSEGTLNLVNSSFYNNTALGASGRVTTDGNLAPTIASGGAVYVNGTGSILNCTFSGNHAKGGKGVGKDPKIASSAGAHAYGGAIGVQGGSSCTLNFLTFVTNVVIGGNTELSSGGGTTGAGRGLGGAVASSDSGTSIQNSIFIGSQEQVGVVAAVSGKNPDVDGEFTDAGGNLFAAATSVVEISTKAPNGTWVYPITKTSVAYNKAQAVSSVTRDQRGIVRPRPVAGDGTGYDIGAFQLGQYTVRANNQVRLYKEENPVLTYTVRDPFFKIVVVSGDASLSTTAVVDSPIGDYPITISQGTLDPSNDYIFIDGTLTINPIALTVTADDKVRPYLTPNPELTYVITDGTGLVVDVDGDASLSTTAVIDSAVGDYPIVPTQGTLDNNYNYTFVNGTLTITRPALTVTADDKTRTYNTENPALTYVIRNASGIIVPVAGDAAISTTAVKASPVGGYPITVTQGTLDNNYTYTFVDGTLTITPAALIVTADDKTRLYNTENPAFTYVVTDGSGAVVSVSGTPVITTTAVKTSPVGDYVIDVVSSGSLDSNYTYTLVDGTLTITRPALTVTADDKTRQFNTENPALTYIVTDGTGAVVSVSGTAALSTTAVKSSPIGDYPIVPAQGTLDNNYTYTFVNGTLTITPAALIVTADNKTRPYNTENPALTYVITDGSGAVVSVSGTPVITTTAVKSSPVGDYVIDVVSSGSLDSNYTYVLVDGTLTITRPALVVTADNKSRLYNTENPALTYIVTDGTGAAVSVSGTAALSTVAVKASPVGDYPIVPTQGTLDNNYTYTFVNGTLTVTRPALIVKADDKTRLYNTENPALTYIVTDGTGAAVSVSGTAALSTTAVKTSPVGAYPITPAQGSLDSNYTYTFVNGTLTITRPALVVTADDKTRQFNTENPTLTYIVTDGTGAVVSVSGTAALSTTAVKSSPIGDYPIVPAQGTLDSNYAYTFVNGTLTITPAALTVTADNKTRLYNTENPALTYVITDGSGTVVSVSGKPVITTTAVKTSPVGDYVIDVVNQGSLDSNYTYVLVDGTLTITRPALTVKADDKTRLYNTENPTLTYVVTDGTGAAVSVSGTAALSTVAVKASPVGDYPIVPTQGSLDNNYTYTFVNGTLTVTRPALIVTADNKTRLYNTENPALTYVVTDARGTVVSVSGTAALSTTAVKTSPVGTYPITPAQGSLDSNYTYTFVNGTLTVVRPTLTVTADDKTRPYNTENPTLTYVITDPDGNVVTISGTAALSTTAVKSSNAGAYPIVPTQGTLDSNYTYRYVNGTLTITAIQVAIGLPGSERYYGQRNADAISDLTKVKVTWTRDDLVFFYNNAWVPFSTFADAFSGKPTFVTDAKDYTAKVGEYNVRAYVGSLSSVNVSITNKVSDLVLADNENNSANPMTAALGDYLRVLPVDLHITAYATPSVMPVGTTPTYSYYYGLTNALTGQMDPTTYFVNGETEANLISRPRARLTDLFVDLDNPGVYSITPYGAQSENYNIIRHDGAFAIYQDKWCMEEGPLPRNYEATGLFEQLVLVKNNSTDPWVGLELNVSNIPSGTIMNATRRLDKRTMVLLHNYPVAPGEVVAFVVEYNITGANALKEFPTYTFTPLFDGLNDRTEVRVAATGNVKPVTSQISIVDVPTYSSEDWTFDTAPASARGLRYLAKYGWASWVNVGVLLTVDNVTPGKTYEVQFSDDNVTWTPVVPRITATSNQLLWTDKGAPKTPDHPLVGGSASRLYKIVEIQ